MGNHGNFSKVDEKKIKERLKKYGIFCYKIGEIRGQSTYIEYLCPICKKYNKKKYCHITRRRCRLCGRPQVSRDEIINNCVEYGFKDPIILHYNGSFSKVQYTCKQCGGFFTCRYSEMKYRAKKICKKCIDSNLLISDEEVNKKLAKHGCCIIERIEKSTKYKIQCKCGNILYKYQSDIVRAIDINCGRCHIKHLNDHGIIYKDRGGKISIPCTKCKKWLLMPNSKSFLITKNDYICGFCKLKQEYFASFNLNTTDDYIDSKTPIRIKCQCGRDFYRILNRIQQSSNIRCNFCTKVINNIEVSVGEFLKTLNIEYLHQDRKAVGRQLDIYIPSKRLGIELDGVRWHSELYKHRDHLFKKTIRCNNNNISLLHFFDFEWNKKREICQSIIKSKLGLIDRKIFARKCEIREVDTKNKNNFLIQNHLQGKDHSSVKYGLYYNNELVFLMTFCRPRFDKNKQWEISRVCSSLNTLVIGGFSKLFSYFLKQNNPESIITYADIRYSEGSVYLKNGLKFSHRSKPSYFYFKGDKIVKRYGAFKKKLEKLLQNYDHNLTQVQNMHNNNYYRVWDCGNLVFKWSKNENHS